MKTKPDLSFWKLWNLSFGFFGVQIAYALQSAQVSRIFSTIGADPHDLSYFWILPPLMGLIVQPIIGSASDRTWTRFGRRLPYLIIGALAAVIVMCFLPNSGSLGLSISSAIMFGLVMLMFLDTSINMAMQPFKMLVGDMVNEKQKGLAYSIQSFICNAGSVVGYAAPFVLAWFFCKTAPEGEVPETVTYSFYLGAAVLVLCVFYTFWKVKEFPPKEYAEYNGSSDVAKEEKKDNLFKLLAKAPKVFWTVGLVQFFCWAAFLYMWSYSVDAIAGHAFNCPSVEKYEGISVHTYNTNPSDSIKEYKSNYLFNENTIIINKGKLAICGATIDGKFNAGNTICIGNDTIVKDGLMFSEKGIYKHLAGEKFATSGAIINIDGKNITVNDSATTTTAFSQIKDKQTLTLASIAVKEKHSNKYVLEDTAKVQFRKSSDVKLIKKIVLNAETEQYQAAGDWNGILLAIQGIAAVLWAIILPRFKNRKLGYSISLIIGAIGFLSIYILNSQYLLAISYALIGCAWAAMLAMPFTILTNALSGNNIGAYLGLFNCTICLPQIIAASVGGNILALLPTAANGTAQSVFMLTISGILLIVGSLFVWNIKETSAEKSK